MCEELGVSDPDTITRWRRDPRVQALVGKLNADRVQQISRKIDSVIEGRLANVKKMDTNTLLRIRKEYGGSAVARTERSDDATILDAMDALEENPEFADDLAEFLERASKKATKKEK